jgi:hypothetical protein
MFHAAIHCATAQPLLLSGPVAPYELQLLREQVLARAGRRTRVEIRCPEALHQAFVRVLGNLERRGVELILSS